MTAAALRELLVQQRQAELQEQQARGTYWQLTTHTLIRLRASDCSVVAEQLPEPAPAPETAAQAEAPAQGPVSAEAAPVAAAAAPAQPSVQTVEPPSTAMQPEPEQASVPAGS